MSRGLQMALVTWLVSVGCSKASESTSAEPSSSLTTDAPLDTASSSGSSGLSGSAPSMVSATMPMSTSEPNASSSSAQTLGTTAPSAANVPSGTTSASAANSVSASGATASMNGQGGNASAPDSSTPLHGGAGGAAPSASASGADVSTADAGPNPPAADLGGNYRPRLINTTDLGGDPDDQQSMVRQLVTSNEFELEGLIVSTSCWKKTQSSTAMLDVIVDAYGEVLSNLALHAEGYPSLEYLQSISVLGNTGYAMAEVGEGKQSAGADLIIAAADRDDPRPLWVTCWGGCNTLAQAVWTVQKTRSAPELEAFLSTLRVYDVLGQDDSGAWLVKNFPQLFYIRGTGVYGWAPSDSWIDQHVQAHGPLGAVYPDTMYDTEGDTPSFMYLYPNGLHDPERVEQGGWGGRFDAVKQAGVRGMEPVSNESEFDPYLMYSDTSEGAEAIARWRPAYDNDFEARMLWSEQNNYANANHHPIAVAQHDESRRVLYVSASAGADITLDAAGSSDPDSDALAYTWSFYAEPSSYVGQVTIDGATGSSATGSITTGSVATGSVATLHVPADAAGKTLHVVLELHDDGTPNLYAYRRVILEIQ